MVFFWLHDLRFFFAFFLIDHPFYCSNVVLLCISLKMITLLFCMYQVFCFLCKGNLCSKHLYLYGVLSARFISEQVSDDIELRIYCKGHVCKKTCNVLFYNYDLCCE